MIRQFSGENRWLSNFVLVDINHWDDVFPSVEHAYQAMKCGNPEWRATCLNRNNTSGQIKRLSRKIELRSGWNFMKPFVMESFLRQKFIQEPFRSKLLATGEQMIYEGNTWGDTYWGVDLHTLKGNNVLGNLLMIIRSDLQVNS